MPELDPKYFGCAVSGLTASLALSYQAKVTENDIVLITAAAGGAGQLAV